MRKARFYKRYRPKIRKKKSILKNRFFWEVILFLVFVGISFYILIFSPLFQVKEIVVSGNERVSGEKIKTIIWANLERKKLFFSTKSIFLVNLNRTKRDILDKFPQIDEVEASRGFPNVLNVLVKERREIAAFLQNEKCFLLDQEGIIFKECGLENDLVKIIEKRNKDSSPSLGDRVLEKEYLDSILKIKNYISEKFDFKVKEFLVLADRLTVRTSENWEIYFDPQGDLNWQLTKLNLVLKQKIPPERRKDLEYIELRFGDLAAFRYR